MKQKQKFTLNDDDDYDEMDNYDDSEEVTNKNKNGVTLKTSTPSSKDTSETFVVVPPSPNSHNTSSEVKSTASVTASRDAVDVRVSFSIKISTFRHFGVTFPPHVIYL